MCLNRKLGAGKSNHPAAQRLKTRPPYLGGPLGANEHRRRALASQLVDAVGEQRPRRVHPHDAGFARPREREAVVRQSRRVEETRCVTRRHCELPAAKRIQGEVGRQMMPRVLRHHALHRRPEGPCVSVHQAGVEVRRVEVAADVPRPKVDAQLVEQGEKQAKLRHERKRARGLVGNDVHHRRIVFPQADDASRKVVPVRVDTAADRDELLESDVVEEALLGRPVAAACASSLPPSAGCIDGEGARQIGLHEEMPMRLAGCGRRFDDCAEADGARRIRIYGARRIGRPELHAVGCRAVVEIGPDLKVAQGCPVEG